MQRLHCQDFTGGKTLVYQDTTLIGQHIRFWYLAHCLATKAYAIRTVSPKPSQLAYITYMNVDEDSDQTVDLLPNWLRQNGRLREATMRMQ